MLKEEFKQIVAILFSKSLGILGSLLNAIRFEMSAVNPSVETSIVNRLVESAGCRGNNALDMSRYLLSLYSLEVSRFVS